MREVASRCGYQPHPLAVGQGWSQCDDPLSQRPGLDSWACAWSSAARRGMLGCMSEQHEPGDRFATGRRFPTTLPAPGTGGGAELDAPVRLYSSEAGQWPASADAPRPGPPVVAIGPGDRVGSLLQAASGSARGVSPAAPQAARVRRPQTAPSAPPSHFDSYVPGHGVRVLR